MFESIEKALERKTELTLDDSVLLVTEALKNLNVEHKVVHENSGPTIVIDKQLTNRTHFHPIAALEWIISNKKSLSSGTLKATKDRWGKSKVSAETTRSSLEITYSEEYEETSNTIFFAEDGGPIGDDVFVYRYYSLETFKIVKENKTIRFAAPRDWPDQWEQFLCNTPMTVVDEDGRILEGKLKEARDCQTLDQGYAALCLTEGQQNTRMWQNYVNGKGVCIKMRLSDVLQTFRENTPSDVFAFYGRLRYLPTQDIISFFEDPLNRRDNIPLNRITKHLFFKRDTFGFEQEIRLLVHSSEIPFYLDVDPNALFLEIETDPRHNHELMKNELIRIGVDGSKVVPCSLTNVPNEPYLVPDEDTKVSGLQITFQL